MLLCEQSQYGKPMDETNSRKNKGRRSDPGDSFYNPVDELV